MKIVVTLLIAVLCAFPSVAVQAKRYSAAQPQTRDSWRSVRTNNLFVIGNADAEKLRQVAGWLEFFHTAFARLVSRNVLDSSVPTTVVIFRDDASFTPFKPLYQGRPANIAGFFQPGDDVNYIALALDPTERDPYSTAFHEYIHLHLRDNVPGAPVWLNEGLAELYGSLQFSSSDALIGAPLPYVRLLRQNELLPLTTLFSIGTNSPHYNEADKTGMFYGESWALVHYLMLGERGRQEQFRRFLQLVSRGDDAAKAIEDAFGMSISALEQNFEAYVRRGNFSAQRIDGVSNPQAYTSYTAMQRISLSEAEMNHYLGDLLLHIGRDHDAESYLKQAIALDPGLVAAKASLGRLYVRQRRYAEAKKYLETGGPPANNNATIAEPVQTNSKSRLLGGNMSTVARDGRTIEKSDSLPSVDELLAKYCKAVGGVAAYQAVTSRAIKATIDVVGVSRGERIDYYAQAPDKFLTVMETQSRGISKKGYNGRVGWSRTSAGLRIVKGQELASLKSDADFFSFLAINDSYAKTTLAGLSKIGYRDMYVLEAQAANGTLDRIYFDAESFLVARINTVRTMGGAAGSVEIYLDDWREVDGIKMPFQLTYSFPKLTLVMRIKEVKLNVPIDTRMFDP